MRPSIKFGADELSTLSFWRAVFAELFGTFLFLICVTLVALAHYGPAIDVSSNNVEIAIGIGLSITSVAAMIGHVSGGHLNPAVSFGLIFAGRVPVIRGFLYMVAQLIGGVAGAGVTYECTNSQIRESLGRTELTSIDSGEGFVLEFFFTFMLVLIVLSITDEKKKIEPYAQVLGIGVYIMVAHVCLIPLTGCGINPARSFGPAAVTGRFIKGHWIYWIGPLLGGAVAALFYQFIFYVEDEKSYQPETVSIALSNDTKIEMAKSESDK